MPRTASLLCPPKAAQPLWFISPWLNLHNTVLVADDGSSLVISPWAVKGGDDLEQTVLTFYHQGPKEREWRLRDFFTSTQPLLPGSVSHWSWCNSLVWTEGPLIVTTKDEREFSFDAQTGTLLNKKDPTFWHQAAAWLTGVLASFGIGE